MLLPSLLTASLIPVLASSWSESRELTRRRYHRVLHLLLLFSAPVAVIGGMTAWRVLPSLPGFSEYEGGGVALSILCGAVAFAYLNFVTQGLLISIHLQRRVLRVTAWATVLNVAGSFVVISLWSYVGAAAMTTATEAFAFSWCLWIAHREAGLGWPVERLPRTVAAVAFAAAVAVPLYLVPPLVQLAGAALAYVAAAYAFRALTPADLEGLRRSTS
jgi:O-antigen/teichoic acid export membrane protein